ncbi:MAG TPA: TadE/TadG family type IV pilus assembly protein [Acetobacteraceae bacterium]|nr:TadE/TadG family type IV pilus assembly protein [Acetobacteraceae bacterium]
MSRAPGRRAAARRGVAAVEFAVASAVLLMLIFTVLDVGLAYLAQQALNNGVAQAVRYAAVNSATSTGTTITSHFVSAVTPALGATQAGQCHVTVSYAPTNTPGGSVTVQATLVWYPLISFAYMPTVTFASSQSLVIQH